MIGETIGQKYEILRLLGSGGMGSVYEARTVGTGERVAVKVIHAHLLLPDSSGPSRFRREAKAAAAVDSEHIVQVLDAGEDEEKRVPYIILEYLEGEDLQMLLDRVGSLRPEAVIGIAGQALTGLQKAHEAGIVHRDIKPANLFLARGEDGGITVKILDFGIAKTIPETGGDAFTLGLTNTGGLLGSPLYMSPEQVQNSQDVDERSDLWSLGSALYGALTGRAPHQDAVGVGKLILAICGVRARPIRERAPWVSPELASVIEATLAVDRDERTPTAGAMLEAIRALAPDGFALRREMLAGVTALERTPTPEALTPAGPGGLTFLAGRTPEATSTSTSTSPASPASPSRGAARKPSGAASREASGVALPRRRAWAIAAAGAAIVIGAGAGAAYLASPSRARLPSAAAASAAAASSAAPAPIEGPRRVKLVVIPADAEVEVDGTRAVVRDGLVEIVGALDSKHQVRVATRAAETLTEVTVTETGAEPLKIEVAPNAVQTPAHGPARSIAAPHPPASSVAAAPSSRASPPAPPPASKEDLLAPDHFR